eukprot:scaffold12226_cov129-Isochrysis_galbana.AAC.2
MTCTAPYLPAAPTPCRIPLASVLCTMYNVRVGVDGVSHDVCSCSCSWGGGALARSEAKSGRRVRECLTANADWGTERKSIFVLLYNTLTYNFITAPGGIWVSVSKRVNSNSEPCACLRYTASARSRHNTMQPAKR